MNHQSCPIISTHHVFMFTVHSAEVLVVPRRLREILQHEIHTGLHRRQLYPSHCQSESVNYMNRHCWCHLRIHGSALTLTSVHIFDITKPHS